MGILSGLFKDPVFLGIAVILFVGLALFIVFAIINFRQDGKRWASIAGVFGTLFGLLFTAVTVSTAISTLTEPSLEISEATMYNPPGGIGYIRIRVINEGNALAKACSAEIVWTDKKTDKTFGPQTVVWGGEIESRDILGYGGSAWLYLLVTDMGKPIVVVPYYKGVRRPPVLDDPQRIPTGDYLLTLTVRAENARPKSIVFSLSVGDTWADLKKAK